MEQRFRYFVGIDWGTQFQCVVLLDGEGRAIEQYNAAHNGDGLAALVEKLKQQTTCDPAELWPLPSRSLGAHWSKHWLRMAFAYSRLTRKQVDRFRDRFTVAGAKDDSRDALVLASSLRTDRKSYKYVQVEAPEVIRLRVVSRFEDEPKTELRRVTNRLWQQLHCYYPQMLS